MCGFKCYFKQENKKIYGHFPLRIFLQIKIPFNHKIIYSPNIHIYVRYVIVHNIDFNLR
jgi:hypothetical protein